MSESRVFKNKNQIVITVLLTVFIIYNIILYTLGTSTVKTNLSEKALRGEQIYQENNCTSCHQIYGLGGYLGPDLTNVISTKGKGEQYVKAFLNSGVKAMPKFNFSDDEKEELVAFLKVVDQSGYYPNYEAEKNITGWVKLKYKRNAK